MYQQLQHRRNNGPIPETTGLEPSAKATHYMCCGIRNISTWDRYPPGKADSLSADSTTCVLCWGTSGFAAWWTASDFVTRWSGWGSGTRRTSSDTGPDRTTSEFALTRWSLCGRAKSDLVLDRAASEIAGGLGASAFVRGRTASDLTEGWGASVLARGRLPPGGGSLGRS